MALAALDDIDINEILYSQRWFKKAVAFLKKSSAKNF